METESDDIRALMALVGGFVNAADVMADKFRTFYWAVRVYIIPFQSLKYSEIFKGICLPDFLEDSQ